MFIHQHGGTAPLRTTARSTKMATITFTATAPNGTTFTRTTGSMAYTHVLMTGNEDGTNWGPYSWHKSAAAAAKAGSGKVGAYFAEQGYQATVVPAVPTSVQGVVSVGDFAAADGWQEEAINALIEAKNAPKAKGTKTAKKASKPAAELPEVAADPEPQPVEAADPEGDLEEALAELDTTEVKPEADATIEQVEAEVADADKVAARKARRAARRAAKRANETADAKAERLAKRRERRAARKAAKAEA
ncbi:hypothetical protein Nigel_95 [Mycobacterium phage Nigel]|uniref:Uncharacterized protein n=1 Tax=Mycobacterium phage Nigel TaxID=543152 RepID=B3VM23_9CAUD|nr:gp95 [Mycobacterium phage Nigel]ACF05097.1 hypothetical protein Nigel_95 [Mycobacterium phage Nigel]